MGKYLELKTRNGYEFVERKIGSEGAVIVIPYKVINGERHYQLILSKRETFELPILEFPAGLIDKEGETVEEVAVRELQEETGWTGGTIVDSIWSEFPAPSSAGLSTELLYFVTIDITDGNKSEPKFDGNEKITVCNLMPILGIFEYVNFNHVMLNEPYHCLMSSRLLTFLMGISHGFLMKLELDEIKKENE